jgi:hypothetical protein
MTTRGIVRREEASRTIEMTELNLSRPDKSSKRPLGLKR